jgi:hypothetical protein
MNASTTGEVSYRAQRVAAWCGPVFMVLTGVGFMVVAGFVPPVPPGEAARQVADRFITDRNSIRAGVLFALFAAALLCPWYAVTSMMVRRITGAGPPWRRTYLIGGTVNVCAFMIPYMTWLTACSARRRPARSWPSGSTIALSAMSLVPPTFLVFFKTGPLAWNGLAAPRRRISRLEQRTTAPSEPGWSLD